jgi:hypothetical protein
MTPEVQMPTQKACIVYLLNIRRRTLSVERR